MTVSEVAAYLKAHRLLSTDSFGGARYPLSESQAIGGSTASRSTSGESLKRNGINRNGERR
jgi:hypothetical protein